ncbi:uncharacterized protein LOC131246541 [Magnolia sinica]|uniref:uncharacterized protein LOC131246541 n=1 Tax=Magnolia sinica TaxID=86752 RepID=UPI00265930AB|nr:uncharacterized protein LOC131246541 [Magnolia sinica]
MQFYDKFNICHNFAELLKYLWNVSSHCNAWRQIAREEEKGVYLNFLNFLINDGIYLLDENLNKIPEVKGIEAEMANTAEWERRPAQERQDRTRTMHQRKAEMSRHSNAFIALPGRFRERGNTDPAEPYINKKNVHVKFKLQRACQFDEQFLIVEDDPFLACGTQQMLYCWIGRKAMSGLLDCSPVCQTIEKELGKPMDALFVDFSEEPLATASIAQVHRATLNNEREVVVKVQHEGIKEVILEDLKNAKSIVDWIAWAEPQYDFNPMIDEWCKEAPRELDFNSEAAEPFNTPVNPVALGIPVSMLCN